MDEDEICTPPELVNAANNVAQNLLPDKSKEKYNQMYNNFLAWQKSNNATSFSENVLLAYFADTAKNKNYKPSTLWANYSMLKTTIKMYNKIDISHYHMLTAYLKKQSTGFTAKKSQVFTPEEINKFLQDAPDEKYLVLKVIFPFYKTGINNSICTYYNFFIFILGSLHTWHYWRLSARRTDEAINRQLRNSRRRLSR